MRHGGGGVETDIVVIGGGAAGCMAALFAAQSGAKVTLLEPVRYRNVWQTFPGIPAFLPVR